MREKEGIERRVMCTLQLSMLNTATARKVAELLAGVPEEADVKFVPSRGVLYPGQMVVSWPLVEES